MNHQELQKEAEELYPKWDGITPMQEMVVETKWLSYKAGRLKSEKQIAELERRCLNQQNTIHGFQENLSIALDMRTGTINHVAFSSDAVRGIDKLKTELLSLRKENEWISVEERLPLLSYKRLDVWIEDGKTGPYRFANFFLGCHDEDDLKEHFRLNKVTHWRPLPSHPPK